MTKSVKWSMKDINTIKNYIKEAEAAGKSKKDGIKDAAKHFGVTYNAVNCRMWKYEHNQNMSQLSKKNTTKVPMKRKKRKYTKRVGVKPGPKPKVESSRSMTFKITNVHVDLAKGLITVNY
jgi:hypothetical protein